jgi:hypothetical protein
MSQSAINEVATGISLEHGLGLFTPAEHVPGNLREVSQSSIQQTLVTIVGTTTVGSLERV